MSLNPVDFDSAIEDLRKESPSADSRARLLKTLYRRPGRPALLRPIGAMALALGLAFALWPRRTMGESWETVKTHTQRAPFSHRIDLDPSNGAVVGESWMAGDRYASWGDDRHGRLIWEFRSDGKRRFNMFDMGLADPDLAKNPNFRRYGYVADSKARFEGLFGSDTITDLLNQHSTLLSQKRVTTPDGERERYVVRTSPPLGNTLTIDAEPESGRIRTVADPKGRDVEKVDYPKHIDDEVFAPKPQVAKGLTVFDLDNQRKEIRARMAAGLGESNGVTLRLVMLDYRGGLWTFWTGAPPDGQLSKQVRLPGLACGPAYGVPAFTSSFARDKKSGPAPAIGRRLEGMARDVKVKLGDFVDRIDIPTPHGVATFRHVPIMRIAMLNYYNHELGKGE